MSHVRGLTCLIIFLNHHRADLCVRLALTHSNPARVSMSFLMDEVFASPFMFKHCLKLKPVRWSPLKHSPREEKKKKFCRALEGVRTGEINDFENGMRMFWGRILRIEWNNKSLRGSMKGQRLRVTNALHPPRPKFSRFTSCFQKISGRLRR